MKHKLFTFILSIIAVVGCIMIFSACNTDNYDKQHEHVFINYIYNNDASCIKDGTETAKCENCSETDTRIKLHTKTEHSFTSYISNNDSTCTADGTKTARCDNCNETQTIADFGSAKHIAKSAEKENYIEPTYETDGSYDLVVHCAVCDVLMSTEHIVVDKITPVGTDIYSKTLSVSGDKIFGTFPNGTEFFRFSSDIVVEDGATYSLCTDILGTQVIPTKIAPLKTGDNTFYLFVENGTNNSMTYIVTLRVRPIYIVSFDTDGGTNINELFIEEGNEFTQRNIPQKTGHTFKNWIINDKVIEFPYKATEDLTIKAIYDTNEYEVSFNANGGKIPSSDTQKVLYGDMINFPIPTRNDYIFVGWSYDNKEYKNGDKWDIAENCELIAIWEYFIALELKTDNTYKVIGINDKNIQEIVVPSNYQGITINEIAERAICDNESVHTIKIPSSVAVLNEPIIKDCKNIQSLCLPYIDSSIGSYFEFSTMNGVDIDVNIPITLTTISIESGILQGLRDCNYIETIIVGENITSIDGYACFNCKSLQNIIWEGESIVNDIQMYAFMDCVSLTNITIPHSITSIGIHAFSLCTNLESVTFEDCPIDCTNNCETKWIKTYWTSGSISTPVQSSFDITDSYSNAMILKMNDNRETLSFQKRY